MAAKKKAKVEKEKKVRVKADAKDKELKKRKKRKVEEDDSEGDGDAVFNPYESFSEDLDRIERQVQVTSGLEESATPMSTGLLSTDLVLGGGIRPAMYTFAGGEQSAKTTTAIQVLISSIIQKIPLRIHFDYEGSTVSSRDYVESIARANNLKFSSTELFGFKDPATGKYTSPPKIRIQSETVGEKFFDYMAEVLRTLPDKRLLGGKWWYRYDDTKENVRKYGELGDKSMPKKYGKGIYIPAPDGKLQALICTDSYPAMNPSDNDEEEANNSLALQARMFSKHLPRIKGRMAQKRVALLGVNQIRAIPMARYGPTEMEPGGQALRFYSDARLKNTSRALSGVPFGWPKGNDGPLEKEPSVTGEGFDTYRYVHQKAIKHKLGQPNRETWLRIWVEDADGVAKGFDPVFDTIFYLWKTGQLTGKNRKNMYLNLHKFGEAKRTVSWPTLKKWILGAKSDMKEISTKLGYKPFNLRAFCFNQVETGVAETLYVAHQNAKTKGVGDEDGDNDD